MPLTADQFAKALIAAGLSSVEEVKTFWAQLPAGERPKDGATFATKLIAVDKLTQFQADELLAGSPTPLVLGDYVLLGRIGAGGMGQVFKAQHRHMERLAAIKLLPKELTQDEEAIKRFQREVKAAAKLSHPNIVQTYDAGVQKGVWYLVMEYVEGRDLAGVVGKEGPLPVARAIEYMRQAAKGLAFAHSKGVVHRDIKPANLLVDTEGTVKILDMGLARIEDPTAKAKDGLTQSGQVMGTVDYMAPEQAFNVRSADGRADIYSLGCTLYRLLTTRNLFDGETIVEKLMAHQTKPIPKLTAQRSDVPTKLVAVFEKMVAKDPADRYQSMADVEAALAALVASPGSESPASEPVKKLSAFLQSFTGGKPVAAVKSAPVATPVEAPVDGYSPTVSLQQAAIPTDPVSERSIQIARESSPRPFRRKQKPNLPILIGGGVIGLLVLLGVWVIVRDRFGNEVGRIKIPEGGTATVQTEETPPTTPPVALVAQAPGTSAPAGFALDLSGRTANGKFPQVRLVGGVTRGQPFTVELTATARTVAGPKMNRGVWGFLPWFSLKQYEDRWSWIATTKDDQEQRIYSGVGQPGSIMPGKPVRIAVVFTGTELLLFVDGRKIGTKVVTGKFTDEPYSSDSMLGLQGNVSIDPVWEAFDGTVDEIRISTNARYAADYQPTETLVVDSETLALYHCDEGAGTVVSDSSPNKHHGKIIDAKWVKVEGPVSSSSPPLAKAPFNAAQAKAHQAAWASHLKTDIVKPNSIGMQMTLIPPGEFLMGSSDADITPALKIAEETKLDPGSVSRIQEERPQHRVRITQPFRLAAHEVTVGQFAKFVEQAKYKTQAEEFGGNSGTVKLEEVKPENLKLTWRTPGQAVTEDSPVTQVSWNDAVAFCNWLSDQEKLEPCYKRDGGSWTLLPKTNGYRLPTEAEWEYACRAGTTTQFSFGDDWKELDNYGWSNKNAGGRPRSVGLLPANAYGLHDMHGNVWEWCQDVYDGKWYEKSPQDDPTGPSRASNRVYRGGGWYNVPAYGRSSYRDYLTPSFRNGDRGFRPALSSVGAPSNTASVAPQPAVPAASSSKLFMHDPAFPQWMAQVQAKPAEQQIEAVSKKLMELNPGFDGTITGPSGKGVPKIVNGVVTEIAFVGDEISDLSPIRSLSGLKMLSCSSTARSRSKMSDLSPLDGLNLSELHVMRSRVMDLRPLRRMPLTVLACGETPLADLSPLHEFGSLKYLNIKAPQASPAAIAALQKTLPNCKIEWDDPAKATTPQPATSSKLFMHDPAFPAWMAQVQAMPAEKQIEAVSKKLVELNPGFDGVLKGIDGQGTPTINNGVVTEMVFDSGNIVDISPVRALGGLRRLQCNAKTTKRSKLNDLAALHGMPLTYLTLDFTAVSDLSSLTGMALNHLHFGSTAVADLSPLRGMPLRNLSCPGTPIADLTPLQDCKSLTQLAINNARNVTPAAVAALQAKLPKCKIEWDDPAKPKTPTPTTSSKLFMHDPAFPQWMAQVQAMPAEQQIEAVSKKLMELNPDP